MVTCLATGKRYIGQTTKRLANRWSAHVSKSGKATEHHVSVLHSAIKKYGRDKFEIVEIDRADSKEELDYMERYWIDFYGTTQPVRGYNLKEGGARGPLTKEVCKRISATLSNKPRPDRRIPIVCVETGQRFDGAIGAAAWLKQTKGLVSSRTALATALNTNRAVGGFHWRTEGEQGRLLQRKPRPPATPEWRAAHSQRLREGYASGKIIKNNQRPIQCVETGQTFANTLDAVRHLFPTVTKYGRIQSRAQQIRLSIARSGTAYGYHWRNL